MLKNGIYYIESAEDILYLQQHPEQPFFVNLMNDTAFRGTLSQEEVMRGFVSAVLKVRKEYYSHIQLLNEKNQRLYSDQIELYVIELNKLKLVPEGERDSLYYWACLFQAASWEECAMIAEKEPDVRAAVAKMREFTEDERLREEYLLEEKIERDRRAALNTAFRRGKEEGEQEGKSQGEERVLKLNRKLMAEKRYDDLEKATEDEVYREKLYREFNLIK